MPQAIATAEAAHINGIPLHAPGEHLPPELLRQRACTELLRQQALQQGLLAQDDPAPHDGATSAAATAAIEQLLEQALSVPEPSEEACRRYHAAHPTIGARGERAHLRHILFAVTPGVNVNLLRQRAEALLLELRCADEGGPPLPRRPKNGPTAPVGPKAVTWAGSPARIAPRNLPAMCSRAKKSACSPAWCIAALACTWCRSAPGKNPKPSPLSRCMPPWPSSCATRPG